MSKKAAEVVEAAPKFKQPWQGFLSLFAIIIIAYASLQWFFNPVSGFLTKMVQANAYVVYTYFQNAYSAGSLGLQFVLNNPQEINLYPQGYLVNWVAFFILGIVWFISIAVLALPFTPSKSRISKQPWAGLILIILSMILAFISWFILITFLKWTAYDVIVLGTIGFFIFPIWATLFSYWPFVPRRPQTHPVIRAAIYIVISWVIAFIIRWIALGRMALGSITTVYSQQYASSLAGGSFLYGVPLTTIQSTEPYDFVISLFFALIVGNTIMSVIGPFPNMSQPKRGLANFIIAIIIGLILWGILAVTIAPTTTTELVTTPYNILGIAYYMVLLPVPVVAHVNITAYLTFPLVVLLFGQFTFEMWPWSRWGIRGNVAFVIMAFIIGTIIFVVMEVSPGFAGALTGANQLTSASGLQTLYLSVWYQGLTAPSAVPGLQACIMQDYAVLASYFEGVGTMVGDFIMFAWTVTVVIFYLLIYEGFEHWPFK
jgi:hypothetical protein